MQPAIHIELMLEDGDPIPEPSRIDAPLPDQLGGVGEVALRTLVRVELPGRAVRLSITMDEPWPAQSIARRPSSAWYHPGVCVVADRSMISAQTISALEEPCATSSRTRSPRVWSPA